jgi:hypothetical protein
MSSRPPRTAPIYPTEPLYTPLIIDPQLPPIVRQFASPLIQSANFANGYLAIANTLHFLSAAEYYRLAARNARFSDDFLLAQLATMFQAAQSKGLDAAFLKGILTAHIGEREKGEEK